MKWTTLYQWKRLSVKQTAENRVYRKWSIEKRIAYQLFIFLIDTNSFVILERKSTLMTQMLICLGLLRSK